MAGAIALRRGGSSGGSRPSARGRAARGDTMPGQRFIGTFGERRQEIELEPLGNGRYAATMGGVRHEVDARPFSGGSQSLLIDGQSYDVELEVAGPSQAEGAYNALVRGRLVQLTVQ